MKNAMVNALLTVDTNHASYQQIIQAQAQYLQRLTAESETRKARLEVLERVIGEKLNERLPPWWIIRSGSHRQGK